MRTKTLVTTLLISLFFIYGCSSSNNNTSSSNEKYHTGTQGLQMSFMSDAPPSTVHEGDSMSVMVQYFNKGATDISGGQLYLTGYDSRYLSLSPSTFTITATGKSIYNPDGNMPYIATSNVGYVRLSSESDSLKQKIKATACYKYGTTASAEVCIAPRTVNVREDVCSVHDVSLSGGQGGPIAVTKIEEEMAGNRVMFKIYFQNVGGGEVYDKSQTTNCHTDLQLVDLNKVYVDSVSLSDSGMTCNPSNPIILQNGQGFVYCTQTINSNQDAYQTQLKIELSYAYRDSIEKEVMIYNMPGTD